MSGNVWEWCWDWFGGTAGTDGTVADSGELTDYTGAALGSCRVVRGGSWYSDASDASFARAHVVAASSRMYGSYYLGFRFACP